MSFEKKDFQEYRVALGFTNLQDTKKFLSAKDIVADIDFAYLEKLNQRIFDIVEKLNAIVCPAIQHKDINTFKQQVINRRYQTMKDNDIIKRMNNLGRRPEQTTFSWLRGYVILQFFLPAIQTIFQGKDIVEIGDDNLDDIKNFAKTPTADLEINDKNQTQKIRLEIQSGFQGVNDIKQHKVIEAKNEFRENNIHTLVIHFDIFNGQVAFVRIDNIDDNDLRWITRQQMEGQTVFEIDQNSFLWLFTKRPTNNFTIRKRTKHQNMRYTVIDLFSGVGGLSYPFHKDSKFDVVVANEILKEPAVAYSLNNPKTKMYNTDIRQFFMQQVIQDTGIKQFDIVLGGLPCQSYSTAGKRDITDPRAELFKEYYRVLRESNAQMFILKM